MSEREREYESIFETRFVLSLMIIDKKILDELTAKAKESPRLRCNLDMRNSADDQSQRMLNALEPGTVMPIHRHKVWNG